MTKADDEVFDLTLDRDADYGTVSPPLQIFDPATGSPCAVAHFDQHGFLFTFHGEIIHQAMNAQDRAKYRKLHAQRAAKVAAMIAYKEVLKEHGITVEEAKEFSESAGTSGPLPSAVETIRKFDLVGWLNGEVKVPFFTVKQAIRDQFGKVVNSAQDAREVIAQQTGNPIPANV